MLPRPETRTQEVLVVALIVILFPPLVIAFLLVMERVEEPLRRPTSQRQVEEFLATATPADVDELASSGIRRAMDRWRRRRSQTGDQRTVPAPDAVTSSRHPD